MSGPVAVRYGFDGHGYQYLDSGSGGDWLTRHADAEPLSLITLDANWVPIDHPYLPTTASVEREALQTAIRNLGEDAAVVSALLTAAMATPNTGSFAGWLWAIAEWAQTKISAAPQPVETKGERG